jgi:hypothetical protein
MVGRRDAYWACGNSAVTSSWLLHVERAAGAFVANQIALVLGRTMQSAGGQKLDSTHSGTAHRYRRYHRFRCSLLIVVCSCRYFQHRHCRPPSDGRRLDFCRWNSFRRVIMFVIAVPVAVVDNDAVSGPRHSFCHRSLPSLLSRCAVVSTARRQLLRPSMWSLFPQLLPLTCRHGHDLLLRKSLF